MNNDDGFTIRIQCQLVRGDQENKVINLPDSFQNKVVHASSKSLWLIATKHPLRQHKRPPGARKTQLPSSQTFREVVSVMACKGGQLFLSFVNRGTYPASFVRSALQQRTRVQRSIAYQEAVPSNDPHACRLLYGI